MAKFRFHDLVRYKKSLIPYLVVGVHKVSDKKESRYSIIRFDKHSKFALDEEKTLSDLLGYGFKIKNEVKEEDLKRFP